MYCIVFPRLLSCFSLCVVRSFVGWLVDVGDKVVYKARSVLQPEERGKEANEIFLYHEPNSELRPDF